MQILEMQQRSIIHVQRYKYNITGYNRVILFFLLLLLFPPHSLFRLSLTSSFLLFLLKLSFNSMSLSFWFPLLHSPASYSCMPQVKVLTVFFFFLLKQTIAANLLLFFTLF